MFKFATMKCLYLQQLNVYICNNEMFIFATMKWPHIRKMADNLPNCDQMIRICYHFQPKILPNSKHICDFVLAAYEAKLQSHMRLFLQIQPFFSCICRHFQSHNEYFACAFIFAYAFCILHMRFRFRRILNHLCVLGIEIIISLVLVEIVKGLFES